MTLKLDHVVILVTDLEQSIADYGSLGFNVQRGGTHADGNTHNALVGFADGSYLELIAFLKTKADHRWGRWAQTGYEGIVDYALLPPSVGSVIEAARRGGVAYEGPFDGGRVRLDGEVLRWQIGTPPSPDLPFLCGDITARALRVREGEVRKHANGVTGIASITVAVRDLDRSLAAQRALLGVAPLAPAVQLAGLGLRQVALPLGPSTLVLVSANPGDQASGARSLRERLEQFGEGVIGFSLTGKQTASLPRDKTHGAAIEIQAGD